MVTLHLVSRELWRRKSLYILWCLSLAAAVSGLMVIDVYRSSLSQFLQLQGRKMLSADVAISARRLFDDNDFKKFQDALPPGTRFSRVTEMFAMISSESDSRLASLRFTDEAYPLIGELESDHDRRLPSDLAIAWPSPDLIPLLDLKQGEFLKAGQMKFRVTGFVKKDSSQTFRGNTMAPRVYLPRRFLSDSHLVQFGSTFKDTWYAVLPKPPESGFKKQIEKVFPDPAIDVTVPSDLEQGSLRVLTRLMDYLGLVGLVTLALGWVGVYYLGRRWLDLSRSSVGLLKCLGLNPTDILKILILELFAILTTGALAGGFVAWSLAHTLGPSLEQALPEGFLVTWSWRNSLLLLLIGPGMGLFLLFEAIWRITHSPALDLVGDRPARARTVRASLGVGLSLLLVSFSLTFLQAKSFVVTYSFLAEILGSLILVSLVAALVLAMIHTFRKPEAGWVWHLITAQWTRRPGLSILLVTVTALSGLLTQLIPHLEKTLIGELKSEENLNRPSVFMFDIQDDQFGPLKDFLQQHGLVVSESAPMVRARLIKVNDENFERADVNDMSTREQEGEARMRNRGVNLSYRPQLSRAEKTIEGKSFDQMKIDPAELSIESSYADRMGLRYGDKLLFDVQGVEVPAQIANVREVDWDSFEPNFFMQLRPGVVDEAPKTWVMTVRQNSELSPPAIQRLVTKAFPNVTSINIAEVLEAISHLLTKLATGLRVASRLSLGLGLAVFFMIILFQIQSSRRDITELHRLGLSRREQELLQVLSFGGLAFFGALLGTALSLIVNWTLARFTFHVRPQFNWASSTQVLFLTVVGSMIFLFILARRGSRIDRL